MFYNPRLDPEEEGRLYADYRLREYQQLRHSMEPWYTERFNANLASASSYERRRQALRAVLKQHLVGREIKRVLDYGGDRGELVQGLFDGAAAFVYDISGISAADGVVSISDPAACKADLIINSNVLEHVGSPRRVVTEIMGAAPEGSLIFLEVPCESPFGASRILRRIAQVAVMTVMRPALARFVIRPTSLFMMHEHINYFTEGALTTLARCCGCTVTAAGTYTVHGPTETAQVAWCMASSGRA